MSGKLVVPEAPRERELKQGQWYWVKEEDGEWLGCVTHIGSNYAEITSPGIDYGGKVLLVFRAGPYLVIEASGSMCWDGIGSPQRYWPSQWFLVRATIPPEIRGTEPWCDPCPTNYSGWDFMIEEVLEKTTPKGQWRKCRDALIEKAKKMADG